MQSNRSETEPLKSRLVGLYMYDWKTRISVMQDLIRLTVHCTAYKTTNGTSALSTMRVNTHKYSLLFGLNSDPSCRRRSGFCEIWMDGSMAQTQCFFGQVWEENETLKEDRLSRLKTRKQSKRTCWCCWWIGPVWVCWDWKCSGLLYGSRSSCCVSAGCGGVRFRFVQTSRDSERCTCQRVSLGNREFSFFFF